VTHPSAAPESLELRLLREIRDEMHRRLHAIEDELRLVVHEQQRLGVALGLARPTPPPPGDSWATPDIGGR
jgi:hypothetical protein